MMRGYQDRAMTAQGPSAALREMAAKALATLLEQYGHDLAFMPDFERHRAERLALDAGVDLAPPRVKK